MPLSKGHITWVGFKVTFAHGDGEVEIEGFPTQQEAALAIDVLSIKEALDERVDLATLQLHSRQGQPRLELLGDAPGNLRREACGASFELVVEQLQECAEHVAECEIRDATSRGLLDWAVWAEFGALIALLLAAAPVAAEEKNSDRHSLLEEAVNAALQIESSHGLQLLLSALPDRAAAVMQMDIGWLQDGLQDNDSGAAQVLLAAAPGAALRTDEKGWTALHVASQDGDVEAAQRLLAAAPQAALAATVHGYLPAHIAAAHGRAAALQLLLAAAPDCAAARNTDGGTPLHCAAGNGCLEAAGALLDCEPATATERALARDDDGMTPAFLAAESGHEAVLQLLLAAAPAAADVLATSGGGLLHAAAAGGSVACLQAVRAVMPAAVDSKDAEGQVPLFWAALNGQLEAVQLLLVAASAAATTSDTDGRTPLAVASNEGHAAVVSALLAAAPDMAQHCSNRGWLPIMEAAANGHIEVIGLLLAADPTSALAKGEYGWTAAHFAAAHGHPEAVSLLLAAEPAAASQEDDGGRLPVELVGRVQDASKRLAVMRALLPFGDGTRVLHTLLHTYHAYSLFADFMACRPPLSQAEWSRIPSPCAGLGRALPAALAHSPEQARQLVRRLPLADASRLRLFALCLHRAQSRLDIYLPQPLVWRILSLFGTA